MKDDTPPPSNSSTPQEKQYWFLLHNWLQTRGWKNRFSSLQWESGPGHAPTWHVVCACPFHFSPRLFDSYTSPEVDGHEYGRGEGGNLMLAKNDAARIAFRRLLYEEAMPIIQRRLEVIS